MATSTTLLDKLRPKLEEFVARRTALTAQAEDPNIFNDPDKYAPVARELGWLKRVLARYDELRKVEKQLAEARDLTDAADDAEMRDMAEQEADALAEKRTQIIEGLIEMLIMADEVAERNAILEIRAGTGGEEAGLFAADLFRMYAKFAEEHGFKMEIIDASETDLGGFKEIIVQISGEGVFRLFRYESGTHRVQRVPATETQGRVHTSAVTVAVMPEAEEVDVDLKPDDYRKDTYRASGKGGQHVNRTESAIRLTHIETGIVVTCQDEKSQHKNFARALQVLRSRLFDHYRRKADEARGAQRKAQIGSGDRSEKIRTYNYPQNRVTDHRLGKNFSLDHIVAGELDKLIGELIDLDKQQRLDAL